MMEDAKTFLQKIRLYDIHIQNKTDDFLFLRELTTKITPLYKTEPVSGGGNSDKIGDAVSKMIALEAEIAATIESYIERKKEVGRILEKISNPDQATVLYKRYFLYKSWEEISREMCMSYRNVCYIHGRALQAVNEILKENQINDESFHKIS